MSKIDLSALKQRMAARETSMKQEHAAPYGTETPTPESTVVSQPSAAVALSSQSSSNGAGSFSSSSQIAMDITAQLYADVASKATDNKPTIYSDSDDDFLAQLDAQKLHEKITQLDSLLKQEHPGYPSLLKDIHTTLSKQPDNVTLLADEEVAVIVSAAIRQAGIQISAKAAKKKTTAASLKGITLEDIGF